MQLELLRSLKIHSAGVTDSALTVHGSLQAERLAKYFSDTGVRFTHIFSSDLQRAYKTASALSLAQPKGDGDTEGPSLEVVALAVLREQDFGDYEGKPFNARPRDSNGGGKRTPVRHGKDPNFKDVESKESMEGRTNTFLKDHLVPIIQDKVQSESCAVAIVSHGILLSRLWRSLLQLLPQKCVTTSPGLPLRNGGSTPLEYLGGWSNTGYLELTVEKAGNPLTVQHQSLSPPSPRVSETLDLKLPTPNVTPGLLGCMKLIVKKINGLDHLNGLKRTRGGVGSSKLDESQKTIESYFKKRKV